MAWRGAAWRGTYIAQRVVSGADGFHSRAHGGGNRLVRDIDNLSPALPSLFGQARYDSVCRRKNEMLLWCA